MPEPRAISKQSIPAALERAKHYRLLNEPAQAESICRDIVAVDPDNQEAWINLLLSLSDQFPEQLTFALQESKECLAHLEGELNQAYYEGMINERWARANLNNSAAAHSVESWILQAMKCYNKAIELAPEDDPDPTLRWNTCARFLKTLAAKKSSEKPQRTIRDVHNEYDDVPFRH